MNQKRDFSVVILKCWKETMIKQNKKSYIRKILEMTLTRLTKGKQKDNLSVQVLLCTVLVRVITVTLLVLSQTSPKNKVQISVIILH